MKFIKKAIASYIKKGKEQKYVKQLEQLIPPTKLRSSLFEDKVTFKHIGLIGDIIYSIPCMLALANDKNIELYLDLSQKSMYPKGHKHYNGDKILTPNSVEFLAPLILSNPKFTICKAHDNEAIDYDLNEFRRYPFDYRMGHICRWYFFTFAVNYDLGKNWISVTKKEELSREIIISRSFRYRAPTIEYNFLAKFNNISFIGLEDEYLDMKKVIPNLKHIKVLNALDLAQTIAGCKFFIGNQSFSFAFAEAIKVKRVLEVCYETPNVIPEGQNGYDFCFQPQFEKIVTDLIHNA